MLYKIGDIVCSCSYYCVFMANRWKDRIFRWLPEDDFIHRRIIPVIHGVLWFVGLFSAKYVTLLIEREDFKELWNILPAFLVFAFEILVTYYDIEVHYRVAKLEMLFVDFNRKFIAIILVMFFMMFVYITWSCCEVVLVLLMLISILLKIMENHLINNNDKYIIVNSEAINAIGNYSLGYSKNI